MNFVVSSAAASWRPSRSLAILVILAVRMLYINNTQGVNTIRFLLSQNGTTKQLRGKSEEEEDSVDWDELPPMNYSDLSSVQSALLSTRLGPMATFLAEQDDSEQELSFRAKSVREVARLSKSSKWIQFLMELNEPAMKSDMFDDCNALPRFVEVADWRNKISAVSDAAANYFSQRTVHEWLYSIDPHLLNNPQNLYVYRFWAFLMSHPDDAWVYNIWISHPPPEMVFNEAGVAPVADLPMDRVRFRRYKYSDEIKKNALQFSGEYGNPEVVDGMPTAWQSDVHRHVLLHNYGGFYFDFDTVPLQSLEPIVKLGLHLFPSFPYPRGYTNGHFLYAPRPYSRAERRMLVAITEVPHGISLDDAKGPSLSKLQHWLLNDGLPNMLIKTTHPSNLDDGFFRMPMGLVDPCWKTCKDVCPGILEAISNNATKAELDRFMTSAFTAHTRLWKKTQSDGVPFHMESLMGRHVQLAMEFRDEYLATAAALQ